MLHLLIERAETGEDIGNSEPFDSARDAALCDGLADGSAQTACYEGVLNGDEPACACRGAEHQLGVEGLYGVHVDDARVKALGPKLFCGLKGIGYHDAAGDDVAVLALQELNALAKFEFNYLILKNH